MADPKKPEITKPTAAVKRSGTSPLKAVEGGAKVSSNTAPIPSLKAPDAQTKSGVTAPVRTGKTGVTGKIKIVPQLFAEDSGKKTSLIERDENTTIEKARQLKRADIARKKRATAINKLRAEEATRDKWMRFYQMSFWALLAGTVIYGWKLIDVSHGDRWPMFHVWIVLVVGLLSVFSAFLWWINRPEI